MAATKIYIYGASGHGLVLADIARACGYDEVVFLDDAGEVKFSPELPKAPIIIAIGANKTRQILTQRVEQAGFEVVNLIHPSAVISKSAVVGKGVVVMPKAVINARAVIGIGAIINTAAVIEHECVVGEFAHISPAAALAGNVKVGARTWIGIGSSVIQGINIGADSIIGAGSVVVSDVSDGVVAYGNPARDRRKIQDV